MNHDDDRLVEALRRRAQHASTRVDTRTSSMGPLAVPATRALIEAAEARLGFSLHPFLRRVYSEVADGGFGPGYGLLSLAPSDGDGSLSSVYASFRIGTWPERVLPLWDWGDAVWSCVDAASPDGIIITHDETVGAATTPFSIRSWLRSWVEGVNLWREMYEDKETTILNPFTNRPVTTRIRGTVKGTPYRTLN